MLFHAVAGKTKLDIYTGTCEAGLYQPGALLCAEYHAHARTRDHISLESDQCSQMHK